MKKLINLIALVMLVSTNVLTPFSYAQEDVPELIPENGVEMVSEDTGEYEKILENNENTLESNEKTPENNEETPKNNEATPEINPEDKEELEQRKQEEELPENVLPDAQDDVKTPAIDENKDEYTEKGESDEKVQPVEENTEGEKQDEYLERREVEGNTEKGEQEKNLEGDEMEEDSSLQKVEEPTIMEVISGTTTTLLPGQEFNQILKKLSGQSNATYSNSNSTIKQILYTGAIPSEISTKQLSTVDSQYPVYAWYDSGIIYYSTKAETIYMNEDSSFMFYYMYGLTGLVVSGFDASNVTNMSSMFSYCSSLTGLNLSNWNTSSVTSMGSMFGGCSKLKELNLSGWNFSKISNSIHNINGRGYSVGLSMDSLKELNLVNTTFSGSMANSFLYVQNLESLDLRGINTKNVTSMWAMFKGCKLSELDLSSFDTSNVTDMQEMFNGCRNLTTLNLSHFDTSKVTNMSNMFYNCSKLEDLNIDNWDLRKANYRSMFASTNSLKTISMRNWVIPESFIDAIGCRNSSLCTEIEEIDVSNWDLNNTKSLVGVFGDLKAKRIRGLETWNTSGVQNMSKMFQNCSSLTGLDLSNWNTSSVTSMGSMFGGCSKLEELNLSGWDFRKSLATPKSLFGEVNNSNCSSSCKIKKLNLMNTKFGSNMSYAFYDMSGLEEVNLSGADTSNVTNMYDAFYNCSSLTGLDLSSWDTSNVTNMQAMFQSCNKLETLNMSGWDFSKAMTSDYYYNSPFQNNSGIKRLNLTNAKFGQSMYYMFAYMSKLEELILKGSDTSNVTNMSYMFYLDRKLKDLNLNGFDTSKVTDMGYMFYECNSLTGLDLGGRDTSKVTNMSVMFVDCGFEKLNLSGWDFTKLTYISNPNGWGYTIGLSMNTLKELDLTNTKFSGYMGHAFGYLKNLEKLTLKGINTVNVTNIREIFRGCKFSELDLSDFDTKNVRYMNDMFYECRNLKKLNLSGWDFSNVSELAYNTFGTTTLEEIDMTNVILPLSLDHFFFNLDELKEIKGIEMWNTSNVTNMNNMFYNCSSLTGLDLSNFDTSNVTDMRWMFGGCSKLENLNLDNWVITGSSSTIGSMFVGDSNIKNLSLRNWTIPESFRHAIGCRTSSLCTDSLEYIDVSNWDLSKTKSLVGVFGDLRAKEIRGLETRNTSGVQSMNNMFYNCSYLTGLDLSNWNTSNLTDMGSMFNGCSSLTGLDLSNFDTSNVTSMGGMFAGCSKLDEINMSGWDFRKINVGNYGLMSSYNLALPTTIKKLNMTNTKYGTTMYSAFAGLSSLEEINLSGIDTSNVTNMWGMFGGCSSLTGLNLSNFDTSSVISMGSMFGGCNNLKYINLSGWDFRNTSNAALMMGMTAGGIPSLAKLNMTNTKYTGSASYAFGGLTKLEELNLDGADTRGVTNMNAMFNGDSKLKYLDLSNFDTSNVTDMSAMFYNCSTLTGLDLSSFDTSNVTSMGAMFYGCSSLTGLDLSSFDTSNVTSMGSMFGGCSKLENLNLDNWAILNNVGTIQGMFGGDNNLKNVSMKNWTIPENFTHAIGCRTSSLCATGIESIDVSNWNLSETKNLLGLFGDLKAKEIRGLETWDTSNVTNMNSIFYNCSNLTGLDLSNFDTSKVVTMGQMFYNTPNLKTIYASNKFVTTALSGDNSSKDMFSGTISVIGGNGTKFDSNYIDKIYAKIDKVGQTGYFTDKNAINVKFINTLDGTETTSTFKKGQKLTPPSVNGYHAVGGYLDEAMTQKIDLNKGVDSYSEIYVKYERNGSSGGGGGGGSKSSDTQDPSTSSQNDKSVSSGSTAKDPVIEIPMDSSDKSSGGQKILSPSDSPSSAGQVSFTNEQKNAYTFAKENGITTKDTIQSAQMNGKLTRIAMAKMLSQYAINVLGKAPDTSQYNKFKDVSDKKDADYDNGVTLAYQLGIMGQNMKNNKFRPDDEVTRAEFVTALSRLLYSTPDGEYKSTSKYYTHHMEKLVIEGIITKADPSMKERRGYVMIMLMRSAK